MQIHHNTSDTYRGWLSDDEGRVGDKIKLLFYKYPEAIPDYASHIQLLLLDNGRYTPYNAYNRKLILRVAFEKYLLHHPELRRRG